MSESIREALGLDAACSLGVALTHRSWTEENPGTRHNERLEYLGDAVLELCVTELLFRALPEADEGSLSRIRAALVKTGSLASVARAWDLGEALRLGKGEVRSGGRTKESLLANAVEAILGAVYLSQGLAECSRLVEHAFGELVRGIDDPKGWGIDPKSALQELTMAKWKLLPRYREVGREGPPHELVFHIEVTVGERVCTSGRGLSKKTAERAAASAALEHLHGE